METGHYEPCSNPVQYKLYDMRAPHTCSSQASNFLIDLRQHAGSTVECRCITIHPSRPELIAIGVNDPFIRIYDRRMIKANSVQVSNFVHTSVISKYFAESCNFAFEECKHYAVNVIMYKSLLYHIHTHLTLCYRAFCCCILLLLCILKKCTSVYISHKTTAIAPP
ncbi:WD and tetratricopeptide repeats protein 1 [Portunus trituberculatus]|uniref:WD and tetratricopeptide repeats protein 1 n=1 Tax=Portunus trituberculatus TaxID=210409 RepID=A0A5B7JYS6_PORTR|nr:WD and tetratricopeptide repeats protein 1 [Portunus trituberculatus]